MYQGGERRKEGRGGGGAISILSAFPRPLSPPSSLTPNKANDRTNKTPAQLAMMLAMIQDSSLA